MQQMQKAFVPLIDSQIVITMQYSTTLCFKVQRWKGLWGPFGL